MIKVERGYGKDSSIIKCEVKSYDLRGEIAIGLLCQLAAAMMHVYRVTEGGIRRKDCREMTFGYFVKTLVEIARDGEELRETPGGRYFQ